MFFLLNTLLLILLISLILFFLFLLRSFIRNLIPMLARGGIYVPTDESLIETMIHLANIQPTDLVADLGSGDGRLLIAAIKAGANHAVGYEIQRWLIQESNKNIKNEGLKTQIDVFPTSFWNADISNVNLVLLYQISYAMKGLEEKLQKELPPGARVVANGFKFPTWKEERTIGNIRLYLK